MIARKSVADRRRLPVLAATLASSAFLLAGCMSAADQMADLGLENTPEQTVADAVSAEGSATEMAASDASDATGTTQVVDAAAADQQTAIAATVEAGSPETLLAKAADAQAADAVAEEPEASTEAAEAAPEAAQRSPSAVAAFASQPSGPSSSNRSLYASLFTEAEARTPVRNAEAGKASRVVVTRTDGVGKPEKDAALPGVDPSSLFEIGQRASADSEDLLEDIGGEYQVASLSGFARLAPNGLQVQREDVQTHCFGSELVSLLRQIERRFGKKVVITSGYRSPAHNKRVSGAKASMHMACKAADLHVPGVTGLEVARYVRSLPNRGGVGTYCHTAAIHVDVGRKRDWNWACRRRQG